MDRAVRLRPPSDHFPFPVLHLLRAKRRSWFRSPREFTSHGSAMGVVEAIEWLRAGVPRAEFVSIDAEDGPHLREIARHVFVRGNPFDSMLQVDRSGVGICVECALKNNMLSGAGPAWDGLCGICGLDLTQYAQTDVSRSHTDS